MRHLLIAVAALAMLAWSSASHAASVTLKDDSSGTQAASPQADEAQPYQSCSQGDQPLFSDFPPKSNADYDTYMHYTVYKDGNLHDIVMWGAIDKCDEARLRRVLQIARPIGTISLVSPGGSLDEAFAMGRTLREFGATTLIEDGNKCISACNFLFMGGAIRMMEPSGVFMVHMFDNHASDTLRAEVSNPPTDLASFLQLFPFRSDVTQDEVDYEVQQVNDQDAQAVAALQKIDKFDLALLQSQQPDQAGANVVASNASGNRSDSIDQNIDTANSLCMTPLTFGLTYNASLPHQEAYVAQCIKDLSEPYTDEDWFSDQARTEDVKAIQQDAAQAAADIARYLSEMSISLRFLTDFAKIPNSTPQALSIDELRDLNVINAD
jgi:hypothetical protein